jgi:hypothetical protein
MGLFHTPVHGGSGVGVEGKEGHDSGPADRRRPGRDAGAETTFDAQQRTAADVSELRSRTASIEQILRTVDC